MSVERPPEPDYRMTISRLFVRSAVRRIAELPISFYLILAIIIVLLLGLKGFRDLTDPRQIAFTVTLFVLFFGAITYRALVDAFEIARKYHRERDDLMVSIFRSDDTSATQRNRIPQADESFDPLEF